MKEIYTTPETEFIRFETEDVITTSGDIDFEPGDNELPMYWFEK